MKTNRILGYLALSFAVLSAMLLPTLPASATSTASSNIVSFRAVLCFAPSLSKKTEFPSASALPTCTSKFELTPKNLGVDPNTKSASGFKEKTVAPDPRFLRFRNTSDTKILNAADVLLPAVNGNAKSGRFVLGPAHLTSSAFKSAKAVKESLGAWVVNYRLTPAGSRAWDAFAKRQFHAMIAVVAYGEVYAAPLIQPTLTHFKSFKGTGEISGSLTKTEAVDLATWLSPKK